MRKYLQILTFAAATNELTGCMTEKDEPTACLDDAAYQQSATVLQVTDSTSDCITFTLENDPVAENGIACFAIEGSQAWDLEGEVLPGGFVQFCGRNGSVDVACVETSDKDNDGEVACEAMVTIKE